MKTPNSKPDAQPVKQGTGTSRQVFSNQSGVHPRLGALVQRHLQADWREPLHRPSCQAFEACLGLLSSGESDQLMFDSGCGTGASTRYLAQAHPDHVVMGIDRSAARLSKESCGALPLREGNLILVRAELGTFWRLAQAAGWRLQAHYLLYPNPWPKSGQVLRRWHAHPVFGQMLLLGGVLELRSNWKIYRDEFALAVQEADAGEAQLDRHCPVDGISPFERKYLASGHALYRLRVDLNGYAERQRRLL